MVVEPAIVSHCFLGDGVDRHHRYPKRAPATPSFTALAHDTDGTSHVGRCAVGQDVNISLRQEPVQGIYDRDKSPPLKERLPTGKSNCSDIMVH